MGVEPSTPTSSLPTHSSRLSRARSTAETRSADARSASNLSKRKFKLNETKKKMETTKLTVQRHSSLQGIIYPSNLWSFNHSLSFFTHAVYWSQYLFITPKV